MLETLPQFDCGSCGYANCRNLAIKIASGEADDSLCLVKRR
ncbi:MAG: (Fe-S)-binding protein [Thomasclavelia spiroformis]